MTQQVQLREKTPQIHKYELATNDIRNQYATICHFAQKNSKNKTLCKRLNYHTEQEVPVFGGSIKQYFQREFINFKQQI